MQIPSIACWVTPYVLTVARLCTWFEDTIAWLAMVRWTCLNTQWLWMALMAHGCTRWRGAKPEEERDQDHQVGPQRAQQAGAAGTCRGPSGQMQRVHSAGSTAGLGTLLLRAGKCYDFP